MITLVTTSRDYDVVLERWVGTTPPTEEKFRHAAVRITGDPTMDEIRHNYERNGWEYVKPIQTGNAGMFMYFKTPISSPDDPFK